MAVKSALAFVTSVWWFCNQLQMILHVACALICPCQGAAKAAFSERQGESGTEHDDKAARGSGFMDKGTIPQYPSEASSRGPVMVTGFSHKFRLPDETIVTWQVWGQARESAHRLGFRSRSVGFMARHRHGYATQLQCSQGWEPYLKSRCQGKEGEPLLRLLSRADCREPLLRLLLTPYKVTSCTTSKLVLNPTAKPQEGRHALRALTRDEDHSFIPSHA